jgi:hypothetical protein
MRTIKSRRSVRLVLAAIAGIAFSIGGAGAAFAADTHSDNQNGQPIVVDRVQDDRELGSWPWP